MLLLLLLLSRFSRVRLCATPEVAAHQAPLSLGFSRQEYWSGLPFPSPMHESESENEVTQSQRTCQLSFGPHLGDGFPWEHGASLKRVGLPGIDGSGDPVFIPEPAM